MTRITRTFLYAALRQHQSKWWLDRLDFFKMSMNNRVGPLGFTPYQIYFARDHPRRLHAVLNVRRKRLNEALIKRSVRRKLTRLGKVLEQGDWVRVEQHALSQVRAIGDIAARARRQKLSLFRFSEEAYQIKERRQTGRNVVF